MPGLAHVVVNRHNKKKYAISTLKNPLGFSDAPFDFYETVVWQKRWLVNEPNEENALLVINTVDNPADVHSRTVNIVECEPPAKWAKKYALERRVGVKSFSFAESAWLLGLMPTADDKGAREKGFASLAILGNRLLRELGTQNSGDVQPTPA